MTPHWGNGWRGFALIFGICAIVIGLGAVGTTLAMRSGGAVNLGWAGTIIGGLLSLVGIGALVGGLIYGIQADRRPASVGLRSTVPYAKVISRHVYEHGRMVIADWEIEALERPRWYVKIQWPDGSIDELETAESVWRNCGEGMFGEAERKGRWLGRFIPYIG